MSRGGHFREDYETRDDKKFMVHSMAYLTDKKANKPGDNIKLDWKPTPSQVLRANFQIQVLSSLFYRNKGAYIVLGRTADGATAIAQYLPQHPFFAGLDDSVATLVAGCAVNVHLRPGQYLFHEGDLVILGLLLRLVRVDYMPDP